MLERPGCALKVCAVCESGRATYLSLDGDQAGNGSVWSQEKTGFCLQILPQVPHMSETYVKSLHSSFHKIPERGQGRDVVFITLWHVQNTSNETQIKSRALLMLLRD